MELPGAAFGFFHDFLVTPNYYVFLESPSEAPHEGGGSWAGTRMDAGPRPGLCGSGRAMAPRCHRPMALTLYLVW